MMKSYSEDKSAVDEVFGGWHGGTSAVGTDCMVI
jgi:hypothetical protein